VAGVLVAGAVAEGRIWFWDKEAGHRLAQPAHCGNVTNWECYFRAPTNCSPEIYAKDHNTIRTSEGEWPFPGHFIPPVFLERLAEVAPHMHPNETKYWWRTQSAAYIMRLNARTVEAVAQLRRGEAMVRIGSPDRGTAARTAARLRNHESGLLPLPRGTLSLHVRHGDKNTEMALVPFREYLKGAEELFRWQPLSLQRTLFVSTEDPQVIQQASTTSGQWLALYSDIPRHNSNGFEQLRMADDMTLLHITQLLMALECDAWVGTLGSNWNRLIDELRCVWVAKCAQPYKEVGSSWSDYNW
jgi:hypothetical protein